MPDREAAFELNATFTVAELLRNGVTTFVEFGSQERVQDALLAEVTRFGTRAYLAPGYDCGRWVGDENGRLKRVRNDELGLDGLTTAFDGSTPRRRQPKVGCAEFCARARSRQRASNLLRRTREAADANKLAMATHAAYSVLEFHDIVDEHMKTPIELLG